MPSSLLFVENESPSSSETPISSSSAFSVLSEQPAATRAPPSKKRKVRATSTWTYYRKPKENEDIFSKGGQRLWYCKECIGRPYSTAITTNARRHLMSDHHIYVEEEESTTKKLRQQALETAFAYTEEKQLQHLTAQQESVLRAAINRGAFYESLINFITRCNVPHNCVTWPEFQALLMTVNYTVEDVLVESASTVSAILSRSYSIHRDTLKAKLRRAKSLIHFSIDLWTSPNHKAFLAICAQWVDEEYKLRKALLGLP